jgi:hypothetical protein
MSDDIFAFTLYTESNLNGTTLFSDAGEPIGRILHKSNPGKVATSFSYDIESTKETFEKLENGSIKLYGIGTYSVSNCHTWYTRSEKQ